MTVPRRKHREPLKRGGGSRPTVPAETAGILPPVEPFGRAPTHDGIARRAYQLFEERGGEPGREWEDWFRAEREL